MCNWFDVYFGKFLSDLLTEGRSGTVIQSRIVDLCTALMDLVRVCQHCCKFGSSVVFV